MRVKFKLGKFLQETVTVPDHYDDFMVMAMLKDWTEGQTMGLMNFEKEKTKENKRGKH